MPSLLVHITCGPENPTKTTLAFLVAAAAVEAGHEVHVFLTGDAVQLLREPVRSALTDGARHRCAERTLFEDYSGRRSPLPLGRVMRHTRCDQRGP